MPGYNLITPSPDDNQSETKTLGRRHRGDDSGFEPPSEGRRVAAGIIFAFLVLLSAAVGSLSGLMLVYSVDLPQIDELDCGRLRHFAGAPRRSMCIRKADA